MTAWADAAPAEPSGPAACLGVERSLKGYRWVERPADPRQALALSQRAGVPEIVGRLMAARHVALDAAADHLEPTLKATMPDPSVLLDMDAAAIRVVHPDTDVTPYDMGTLGSRSTFHMGNAVRRAAEDAKHKIAELAKELGLPEGSNLPLSEMFKRRYGMQAGNIIGTGSYIPDYEKPDVETGQSTKATPFWGVAASAAEVEVDTETGHFTITKLINVADVGTALNPKLVRLQLSGAAIMQLGFTTTEEMIFRDGQLTNGSFADYKIPTLLDIPREFVNTWTHSEQKDGPFGAKGAGESTTITLSAAIGNAIADAVGVRLTDLPLTPEKIYRALIAKDGAAAKGK